MSLLSTEPGGEAFDSQISIGCAISTFLVVFVLQTVYYACGRNTLLRAGAVVVEYLETAHDYGLFKDETINGYL